MRSDAARNHQRVLAAAREVLAKHGSDTTMELIAAAAGVGVGTVYRRFGTKDALIDELVRQIFDDMLATAQSAVGRGDGSGLEIYLRALGAAFLQHRGHMHLLDSRAPARGAAEQLRGLIGQLVDQARDNGLVGPDTTLGDVMTLIWAIRGIIETSAEVAPHAWQRHLDIHLTGLRYSASPSRRPSISTAQLAHVRGPDRFLRR
jgi:AcrR family transcriptional regulator